MIVARGRSASTHAYLMVILGIAVSLGGMQLWSARTAVAQEYPISEGELIVSDSTVAPGSTITVSGEGFAAGAEVTITIGSDRVELARVDADAAGRFIATVTIPANITPGTRTVEASGEAAGAGTLVLSSEIVIEGDLPFTGTSVPLGLFAAGAVLLVAAGAITVRLLRR